jgi:hypothetical protein
MRDSRCYRSNAADCVLAAEDACQPHDRKLRISMAVSWLSLARRDELASWDRSEADCGHQAAAV